MNRDRKVVLCALQQHGSGGRIQAGVGGHLVEPAGEAMLPEGGLKCVGQRPVRPLQRALLQLEVLGGHSPCARIVIRLEAAANICHLHSMRQGRMSGSLCLHAPLLKPIRHAWSHSRPCKYSSTLQAKGRQSLQCEDLHS